MNETGRILVEYQSTGTVSLLKNNEQVIAAVKKLNDITEKSKFSFDKFNDAMNFLPKTLTNVGKSLESTGKQMYYLGTRLFTSVSLPIIGVGTAAIKTAMDFDQAMSQVRAAASTTAVVSEEQYAAMKNAVLDMSMSSVKSAAEISTGFYELVSAGYSVADSIKMLPQVVEFATASAMDMGTAAQFASSQLHAWGGTGITLQEIMDKTSTAVQISQLHFDEFTKAINMAAPAGRVAGQDFDQTAAALMAMADRGAVAGKMGMNLRAAFLDMAKKAPIKQMEELRLSFADISGNIKPLNVIAKELGNKLSTISSQQERLTIVQKLFASNAATAMIPIMEAATGKTGLLSEETLRAAGIWDEEAGSVKESAKSLDEYLQLLKESEGATKRMSDAVEATPWAKITILTNKYKATLIKFGTDILNAVYPVLNKVSDLLWNKLGSATLKQKLEILGVALGLVVGPLMLMLMGAFVEAIGAMVTVIGFLLTPLGILGVITVFNILKPIMDQATGSANLFGGGIKGILGYVIILAANLGLISNDKAWEYIDKLGITLTQQQKDGVYQKVADSIGKWKTTLKETWDKIVTLKDEVVNAAKWIGEHRLLVEGLALAYAGAQAGSMLSSIAAVIAKITGSSGLIATIGSVPGVGSAVIIGFAVDAFLLAQVYEQIKGLKKDLEGLSTPVKIKILLAQARESAQALHSWGVLFGPIGQAIGSLPIFHKGGLLHAQGGMIIPGSSPLRDRVPVMAEQGEGIMSRKAIENLLKTGLLPSGGGTTYNINFNPGVMIATPGEQRAFARDIKKLIEQDNARYAQTGPIFRGLTA